MRNSYILFLLFFVTFASAQNTHHTISIDDRLLEIYDQTYLENLKSNNPVILERWNFYLDHAWFLADLPVGKEVSNYKKISIPDLENINILLLEKAQGLSRDWEKFTFYRIEGTDQMLVYYPGKEFTAKLNEHLGRTPSKKGK